MGICKPAGGWLPPPAVLHGGAGGRPDGRSGRGSEIAPGIGPSGLGPAWVCRCVLRESERTRLSVESTLAIVGRRRGSLHPVPGRPRDEVGGAPRRPPANGDGDAEIVAALLAAAGRVVEDSAAEAMAASGAEDARAPVILSEWVMNLARVSAHVRLQRRRDHLAARPSLVWIWQPCTVALGVRL